MIKNLISFQYLDVDGADIRSLLLDKSEFILTSCGHTPTHKLANVLTSERYQYWQDSCEADEERKKTRSSWIQVQFRDPAVPDSDIFFDFYLFLLPRVASGPQTPLSTPIQVASPQSQLISFSSVFLITF